MSEGKVSKDGKLGRLKWGLGKMLCDVVRRCKLDPGLKATCFQPLNLRVHTVLST